jgi:TnsA endonuclease N terminal
MRMALDGNVWIFVKERIHAPLGRPALILFACRTLPFFKKFTVFHLLVMFKPESSLKRRSFLAKKWISFLFMEEVMPVKDPLKQSGHYTYAVPAEKLGQLIPMVHCESSIERDYAYVLKFDPMVVSFEEQPFKISYFYDQQEHYYIPDFAVYWRHKQPSLVECKPASKLNEPENQRKWTAARLWCEQHHYTFELVTDTALQRLGTLLSNIKHLAGYGHQECTPQIREYLLRTVQAENRALSVAELVERHPQYNPTRVRCCIWHLLYTRGTQCRPYKASGCHDDACLVCCRMKGEMLCRRILHLRLESNM